MSATTTTGPKLLHKKPTAAGGTGTAKEVSCPEGVTTRPIGTETALEADGCEPYVALSGNKRKEIEATLDEIVAEVRQLAVATAVLGAKLVGSDDYARARGLVVRILSGDRPLSELTNLLRRGYSRSQAVRALQAFVRYRLQRAHEPNREQQHVGLAQAVRPGSVEMFEQGAARELSLQRLRHGVGWSSEVRAAEARCGIPLGVWMASELAAGHFRGFLRQVPRRLGAHSWRPECREG